MWERNPAAGIAVALYRLPPPTATVQVNFQKKKNEIVK